MSALLDGFKDDGCIKGLFGGDSSSSDEDEQDESDIDTDTCTTTDADTGTGTHRSRDTAGDKDMHKSKDAGVVAGGGGADLTPKATCPEEFSEYKSRLDSTGADCVGSIGTSSMGAGRVIKLETNKLKGIAHQVSQGDSQ